ncbi:hypothetical protein [Roseomonas gilardii]|uniref:hypothetical protein n=1 Tax=Roseomonas gilardii TaxID=257708 RepID=UPI0004ACD658|nr:hypothetical protein [Roseomonas gilardii]SUE42705.1 Uncharacterised protein [Roseomonas gilardii subsp. rosea]
MRAAFVAAGDAPVDVAPDRLPAHSAFRTPEASNNLIEAAPEHCRPIQRENEE